MNLQRMCIMLVNVYITGPQSEHVIIFHSKNVEMKKYSPNPTLSSHIRKRVRKWNYLWVLCKLSKG
jgi:hypothetical protein